MLEIFNVRTDVNACDYTRGLHGNTERESALKAGTGRETICRTRQSNLPSSPPPPQFFLEILICEEKATTTTIAIKLRKPFDGFPLVFHTGDSSTPASETQG